MEKRIVVAIDVGTTKVCTLIAQIESENHMRILGVGIEPSQGIRKGSVVDIPLAASSIAESVRKAERTSGLEVTSAIVSVAGSHISSINNKATVGIVGGVIDHYDVNRVLEAVRAIPVPHNKVIIHPLQRTFSVDGVDGIRSPIGMFGSRLDVEAHIIIGSESSIENLRQCIMTAEVEVNQWVLNPLADGETVLTDIEKQMGVIVCDIGGGTTDLALYIDSDVWHTNVIPVGGSHITSDIAQAFHLPISQAEEVKKQHGHALPDYIGEEEYFYCKTFGKNEAAKFNRKELSQIIHMRTEEIFQLVLQEIKRSGYDNLLPAGMVLTGGTALLPGIDELASNVLKMPVRIAKPENLTGMIDQLNSPAFSTSVGLLYWAMIMQQSTETQSKKKIGNESLDKIKTFLRNLLP
jgi:cell division protein FtsA